MKIIVVLISALFIVVVGQFHWQQQIKEVTVAAAQQNTPAEQIVTKHHTPEETQLPQLVLDYEVQFADIIIDYQESVNQLLKEAKADYYQQPMTEPQQFRDFIATQVNEIDKIYEASETEYQTVHNDFSNSLVKHGYHKDDALLYYLLFEDMAAQTQMSFVSQLISLQK